MQRNLAFCHKCGRELPRESAFCPACGTPVVASPTSTSPIVQPQPIGATANYATVGDRLVAVIIDSVILLVPLYVLAIAIPIGLFTFGLGFFPTLLFGPFILTWWVLALLYFTFFEGTTGQTLGKQAVSIKVVDEVSQKPVNMERALLRNILRIIDWFPFFLPHWLHSGGDPASEEAPRRHIGQNDSRESVAACEGRGRILQFRL